MRREGSDENNLQPADFLCDFCGNSWADDRHMVEGHRGSLICSRCLALAYDELWNRLAGGALPPTTTCMMCLEEREESCWPSPVRDGAWICKRCTKQSAVMLERDPEANFKRPAP